MILSGAEAALARGDAASLAAELRHIYPDDDLLPRLSELISFVSNPGAVMPRVTGARAHFVASIAAAKNFWLQPDPHARRHHCIARRCIGAELDFLGEWHTQEDWGVLRALNYLVLNQIKPTRRAAVVGTMRDDGLYALEWIAHHRALGFDAIFVYTNDNADGSEHLFRRLADHNVIGLIESETSGRVRPEVKAFEHATHLLHDLRDCAWVLFVDSDEFLQLPAAHSRSVVKLIDAIEAAPQSERPSAIAYEWLWFNSSMVFARQPGLLQDRFQHASPHWLTKSFVRLSDLVSMRMQHVPDLRDGCIVANSLFQAIDPDSAHLRHVAEYEGGRINHYWPKSFEEFSLKKARGDTLHLDDERYRTEYHQSFRRFFEWNAPDTMATFVPADAGHIAAVQREIDALRKLDGVAELELDVQKRFAALLSRYDKDGGLRAIYHHLHAEVQERSLPVD